MQHNQGLWIINRIRRGLCDPITSSGRATVLLGELDAGFPWGVLLITDDASTEEIPPWMSDEEQVTSAKSAIVVRVKHQDEGPVSVRVWDHSGEVRGGPAFAGAIECASGTLRVSDALGEQSLRIPVQPGAHKIEIFTEAAIEATQVHVLVDRSDEP